MDNKLIVEINQIRSNMGLSVVSENTQIILEAPPSTSVLEGIFKALLRPTSTSILKNLLKAEEIVLLEKYFQNEIKDIATKLKFAKLMKLKGAATLQELKRGVMVAFNNGAINDTEVIVYNNFLKKMENTKTTWVKKATVTDVAGQQIDDLVPLTQNELSKLEKLYRPKGLGKSFLKAMRQFSKKVNDMMKAESELMDETLSLIKTFKETQNDATKTDIIKRISDNTKKLTQLDTSNKEIIGQWIDSNVLDRNIRNKIKNTEGYKKAAQILDGTAYKKWNEEYKKLSERRSMTRKQINSMFNPASWLKGNMKKWGDGLGYGAQVYSKWRSFIKGPEFQELRNYLALGQTQKWSGINSFRKEFGLLPAIGNVAKEWAYSYVVLSMVYGFLDYTTTILGHYLDDFEMFKDIEWIQKNSADYDKDIQGRQKTEGRNFIQGWGYFLLDLSKYMSKYLSQLEVAFPGLIFDDLGTLLYEMSTGDITPEKAKKMKGQADTLKENVGTEIKKIESGTEKTIDTAKDKVNPIIDKAKDKFNDPKQKQSDKIKESVINIKEQQKNMAELTKGWVKDPTGNKTWEYQVRDCKWIAKKIGIATEYKISENPKYDSSVQKLNKAYPDLIANCNKTKVDPNAKVDPNTKVDPNFYDKAKNVKFDAKIGNNSTLNAVKITTPEIENLDGENPNDV